MSPARFIHEMSRDRRDAPHHTVARRRTNQYVPCMPHSADLASLIIAQGSSRPSKSRGRQGKTRDHKVSAAPGECRRRAREEYPPRPRANQKLYLKANCIFRELLTMLSLTRPNRSRAFRDRSLRNASRLHKRFRNPHSNLLGIYSCHHICRQQLEEKFHNILGSFHPYRQPGFDKSSHSDRCSK